jgi:hypothetical protein
VPAANPHELRRDDASAPARVLVHFPSQHLLEEAFHEGPNDDGGLPLLMRMWLAHGEPQELSAALGAAPSRVAFVIPDAEPTVPATLNELLEFLTRCELGVVRTADASDRTFLSMLLGVVFGFASSVTSWVGTLLQGLTFSRGRGEVERPSREAPLVEPGPDETAIELPYRLILSPRSIAGFAHESAVRNVPPLDSAELWHSRLGVRPGFEGKPTDSPKRTVRAVWVRNVEQTPLWNPSDYRAAPPKLSGEPPFLASMSEFDRHAIAHLTSNTRDLYTQPIEVELLALSGLGGWLTSNAEWDSPPLELNLEAWRHRAALGRDNFVKLVYSGYLFPFGHRASLVKITERKWQEVVPGRPAALRQRKFLIVRQRELRYAADPGNPFARKMPLKRVVLRTLLTPNLDTIPNDDLFLPAVGGQAFVFAIEADDGHDGTTAFAMPLVFMSPVAVKNATSISTANGLLQQGDRHRASLGGSPLALVEERAGEKGSTTFPVGSAAFGADPGGGTESGFHPRVLQADVALPAVELVSGQGQLKRIEYAERYLVNGLGGAGNQGEVFARLLDPLNMNFGSAGDKGGGILQPSLAISGLSRSVGPIAGADLGAVADGSFDPEKFFAGIDAKLFGVFPLTKLLQPMLGALDAVGAAPKLVTKQQTAPLEAEWRWSPRLRPLPADDPVFAPQPGAELTLTAHVQAKGPNVEAEVHGRLSNVRLDLVCGFHFYELPVNLIKFDSVAGSKSDIHVELGEGRFVGALSFIDTLRKLIPGDGFSDPPALQVTPEGISSGFSVALPDIAVGMLALQHVSLGGRLELPFTGPPLTFAFNFCTREGPFSLTVSMFGGGGFFLMKVDPNGVQRIEAAFEFGASVSINLGVASGGVHVMAGIYFCYDTTNGVALSGYFRLGGNVSVLGLVSVSIELNLSLTYEAASGKALGRATLTVEIELFLFSTSVEIECERKFAGSKGDPTFAQLMSHYQDPDEPTHTIDPWAEYCASYA